MTAPEPTPPIRREAGSPPIGSPTPLPAWVTMPLARAYAWEAGRRSRRFDRGVGVERVDHPVISVGNLSAGGTGKSPVVRWVVRTLQAGGHTPAVAMRGYKAKPGEASDEQAEHAEAMPGVPIVARPDRVAGLRSLFATEEGRQVDCVVLDDGFQHRRLARDLDIVLIDATRPPARDALLPLGFLREPPGALARAGAVLVTRGGLVGDSELAGLIDWTRGCVGAGVPVVRADEVWERVRVFTPGQGEAVVGADALRGKRLWVCCGIGNPGAFIRFAEANGVEVVGRTVRADHAAYSGEDAARIFGQAGAGLLTTGKDWVKLRRFWRGGRVGAPVYVPELGLRLGGSGPAETGGSGGAGSAVSLLLQIFWETDPGMDHRSDS